MEKYNCIVIEFLLSTLMCIWSCALTAEVLVNTVLGQYKGQEILVENKPITAFMGVGYAEPPVGKNRWKRPIPVEKFADVKDCLSAKPVCPQIEQSLRGNYTGDENCLYMDIMSPGSLEDSKSLKPVLVYLSNDEAFQTGISHTGSLLSKRESIVAVIVYSRLGALGYMYDGPGTGTNGLWDNLEALRWIYKHIENFGGDPESVTLMGVDSGALVARLLALSPLSDGLFSQLILMSPYNMDMAAKGMDYRESIREMAGCGEQQLVSCDLSSLTAEKIVTLTVQHMPGLVSEAIMNDKELFPQRNENSTVLQDYNILMGVGSGEMLKWSTLISEPHTAATNGTINQDVMKSLVKLICKSGFTESSSHCLCQSTMGRQFSITSPDDQHSLSTVQRLLAAYGKSQFVELLADHAKSESSSTYVYYADIKEDEEIVGVPEEHNVGSDSHVMAKLVLGYPYLMYGRKYESVNEVLHNGALFSSTNPDHMFGGRRHLRPPAQKVMRYFANFIKSGDPNEPLKAEKNWPDYKEAEEMMTFVEDGCSVTDEPLPQLDDYQFFNDVYFQSKKCSE